MSITIERSKFMQCIPIYDSPRFRAERVGGDVEDPCSSSSVGRNSDTSDGGGDESGEENEVQSSFKGPLDTMNALQEVLPLKYVFRLSFTTTFLFQAFIFIWFLHCLMHLIWSGLNKESKFVYVADEFVGFN